MATAQSTTTKATKPRRRDRVIHFLTQEELKRLLAVIKDKRDRAIFLVAYRRGAMWT